MSEFKSLIEQFAKAKLAGDDSEAFSKSLEALALAAEELERNPTRDMQLMKEAADREARADWDGAERIRQEILALRETEENEGCLAKAHLDLSELFQLRGRLDAAWESALEASAAARQFGSSMFTALMLDNEAKCALRRGDVCGATRAMDEAFAGLESSPLTRGMRARLWASRARCQSAKQNWQDAEAALDHTRRLMDEERSPTCCPGPMATEAAYSEVQAVILAARGDANGAVKAWQEAVANRRALAEVMRPRNPRAAMALAKALESLGDALAAIGRVQDARSSHVEARELRRRVDAGLDICGREAGVGAEGARQVLLREKGGAGAS
ncbi:MAG: hypothetical protein KJ072_11770 [Verrucomicrobia bacterium]|nr:hypothetical protein [Verrucomicrobiota bacterium]